MESRPELGREDFGGDDEGGRVGAEIGKEERERIEDEEDDWSRVRAREGGGVSEGSNEKGEKEKRDERGGKKKG